jgi:integrase
MRGHGEGTIFRNSRGLWVAKVSLPDGRRLERTSKDRAIAERYRRELLRLVGLGVEPRPRLTLAAFLDDWLNDQRERIRPQTLERYESVVRVHLVPGLGHVRLQQLRPSGVDRFLASRRPRTGQQCRAVLRTALNAALRDRLVEYNAAELARPVEHEAKPAVILEPAELARFLEGVADDRLAALWVLAAMSGMREAELLGLAWDDLDLEAGVLHVRQQLVRLRGEWVLAEPKTRKGRRTIPVNSLVVAALREHRRRAAAERTADWPYFGLVFTTERGTPIYGWRLVRMLRGHLVRLGIDKALRVHDLRHTMASHAKDDGAVSDEALAAYLGQSKLLERYIHALAGSGRTVADAMERAVR